MMLGCVRPSVPLKLRKCESVLSYENSGHREVWSLSQVGAGPPGRGLAASQGVSAADMRFPLPPYSWPIPPTGSSGPSGRGRGEGQGGGSLLRSHLGLLGKALAQPLSGASVGNLTVGTLSRLFLRVPVRCRWWPGWRPCRAPTTESPQPATPPPSGSKGGSRWGPPFLGLPPQVGSRVWPRRRLRPRQSPPPLHPHVPALASLSLTDASGRQRDPVPSLSLLASRPSSTRTSQPPGSVGDPSRTLGGLGPHSVEEDASPRPAADSHPLPEPHRLLGPPPLHPRVGPSVDLGTLCKARLCRPLFQEAFPHPHTPHRSTCKGPCRTPALTNTTGGEAASSSLRALAAPEAGQHTSSSSPRAQGLVHTGPCFVLLLSRGGQRERVTAGPGWGSTAEGTELNSLREEQNSLEREASDKRSQVQACLERRPTKGEISG